MTKTIHKPPFDFEFQILWLKKPEKKGDHQ